jgi:single-stranded-DNA-specific exonuclease
MQWCIAKQTTTNLIDHLLNLRKVKNKDKFLNPPHPSTLTTNEIGLDKKELEKALTRINKAIKKKEKVVIYGDYDADGVCATAILWESLNSKGAKVLPFIPNRKTEGYGFSKAGIENMMGKHKPSLVITVDHGISGLPYVQQLEKQGVDVLISDHHQLPSEGEFKSLKKYAKSVVHTTRLAGAGVAWFIAESFTQGEDKNDHLGLAALGTIADAVPLKDANRQVARFGLEELTNSQRVGLTALKNQARIGETLIEPYHIGFILGPRINAAGRLESALVALRLLCTNDVLAAQSLADKLGRFNRERQKLLEQQLAYSLEFVKKAKGLPPLIILADETYDEGIIGLIAGKLTDKYFRPSIVISKGKGGVSKASARSIPGVNIIELIREAQDLLISVGGHPMAAGFTLETNSIETIAEKLLEVAQEKIEEEHLERVLEIDGEVSLEQMTREFYEELEKFAPFGVGNTRPLFASKGVFLEDVKTVGNVGKHLKFKTGGMNAIAFSRGYLFEKLDFSEPVDIAYSLDLNRWNNQEILQLKVRDLKQG